MAAIGAALADDKAHRIKAVCVVHNETSTGCTSRIDEVRAAIDAAKHPALLMVDTISSLASIDYRHDEWGVDVTVAGSQKGLMLPPGLSFNAISDKALKAAETAKLPRSYWDWRPMLEANKTGYFPYTPGTNLLFGLNEAVKMLLEEGLANVFARHDRHAEATRRAVRAWGLEVQCAEPRHYSSSLTAVRLPEGHSADALRATILEKYNMSLGNGLGILKDRVFRIGHLGDFGDLQLDRHAGRRRDGAARRRRAAQAGRRAGGDRLPVGQRLNLSEAADLGGLPAHPAVLSHAGNRPARRRITTAGPAVAGPVLAVPVVCAGACSGRAEVNRNRGVRYRRRPCRPRDGGSLRVRPGGQSVEHGVDEYADVAAVFGDGDEQFLPVRTIHEPRTEAEIAPDIDDGGTDRAAADQGCGAGQVHPYGREPMG